MRPLALLGSFALCALLLAPAAAASGGKGSLRSAVVTVEGTVTAVTSLPAEGDLPVVAISLVTGDDAKGEELIVLLGPEQAMDEIGFAVETGDRCRVRIFRSDDGTARAHKVLNVSRGTMVRLRTMHQVPLWNGQGSWQGGPCRSGQGSGGGGGKQHHGGR